MVAENKSITRASCNERQVVISITGGELIFFNLDERGSLEEDRSKKEAMVRLTT